MNNAEIIAKLGCWPHKVVEMLDAAREDEKEKTKELKL